MSFILRYRKLPCHIYSPQSSPTPSLSPSIWSGLETESQLSAKQIEQQNVLLSAKYCALVKKLIELFRYDELLAAVLNDVALV